MADDDADTKKDINEEHVKDENPASESPAAAETESTEHASKASAVKPHIAAWQWLLAHKPIAIPAAVVVLLVLIFAVPFTRYTVLGLFLKQDFAVSVVDSQTGKPVSSAQVTLDGKSASTDGSGKATIRAAVGARKLAISKTYYKQLSQSVVVPLKKPASALSVKLEATGRPVPITITNSISGKPVANVVLSAGKSQAKTDAKGQAVLVVAANDKEIKATLSASGYNTSNISIKPTTDEDAANKFKLTPAGKVYFLSNQSGKIDVVESNLDGSGRKVILAGTGKETKTETVLLATRDWKYLALQSKRDGGNYAKLYLINTADGSLTTMDEGDATFTLTGWEGHYFIYKVDREKIKQWEPKRQALKSYNADTKKITTLDETTVDGGEFSFMSESLENAYVLNHQVVYIKNWGGNYYATLDMQRGKQATLNSISPSKENKKVIKGFAPNSPTTYIYVSSRPYNANELYLQYNPGDEDKFYEYDEGKVKDLPNMKSDDYYNATYATYLASPSGDKTFWSEDRDGKLAFMIGNASGESGKPVATLSSDYQTYGWYTDNYLLVSKKGSELYILPASGVQNESQLFKVTDYYRPVYTYRGYGGGYGGL